MEGKTHTAPEIEFPELDLEAQLVVVSGPVRSGKTTVALHYAWEYERHGYSVMAFRPMQDTRHERPFIESQSNGVEPFPAERVQSLGKLATYAFTESDVLYLDEPFMWSVSEEDPSPQPESVAVVERALSLGAKVLVSTLDKSFLEEEFDWYKELHRIGTEVQERSGEGSFLHLKRTGVCDLCPGDDPALWQPSVSTNYYIRGEKVTDGNSIQPENDPTQKVYAPCCNGCRDSVLTLPLQHAPRFPVSH